MSQNGSNTSEDWWSDWEKKGKQMPYPNGGYLGPGYVIGGMVALIIVFAVLGWGLWVYFR